MKVLTFVLCILSLSGFSQTLIKGKVVDERGESIPGANILLVGTYDGTTTDGTGSFTFRTDEKGTKVGKY
jgi:hypothetical protein